MSRNENELHVQDFTIVEQVVDYYLGGKKVFSQACVSRHLNASLTNKILLLFKFKE